MADFEIAGHLRTRTGSVLPGVAPSNVYPHLGRFERDPRRQCRRGVPAVVYRDEPVGSAAPMPASPRMAHVATTWTNSTR